MYQLAEECRGLRRLQAFRRLNACALISLPYSVPAQDAGGIERNTSNKTPEVSHTQLKRAAAAATTPEEGEAASTSDHPRTKASQENATTTYRLRHLACSLRPTVSCHKLDHTRPGHPSDVPPMVHADVLRKSGVVCGVDDMLTRLIIPNNAPTSIRCVDNHRPCMAPTGQQGEVGDSLSIAHQRQALLAVAGRRRNSRSSSSSTLGSSSRTTNTAVLSPS